MKVQLFDEDGQPATEIFEFETAILCPGQLTEAEMETIQNLDVGQTDVLIGNWTVKRHE